MSKRTVTDHIPVSSILIGSSVTHIRTVFHRKQTYKILVKFNHIFNHMTYKEQTKNCMSMLNKCHEYLLMQKSCIIPLGGRWPRSVGLHT